MTLKNSRISPGNRKRRRQEPSSGSMNLASNIDHTSKEKGADCDSIPHDTGDDVPVAKRSTTIHPSDVDGEQSVEGKEGADDNRYPSKVSSRMVSFLFLSARLSSIRRQGVKQKQPQPSRENVPPTAAVAPESDNVSDDGQQSWRDKYNSLLIESQELHHRKQDELELLKKQLQDLQQFLEFLQQDRYCEQKRMFRRNFGYNATVDKQYWGIYAEISTMCRHLNQDGFSSKLKALSEDSEFWEIASLGRESWLEKLLDSGSVQVSCWVLHRIVLSYVLRWIFGPTLVGLDKEVEALLLVLGDKMESKMRQYFLRKIVPPHRFSYHGNSMDIITNRRIITCSAQCCG